MAPPDPQLTFQRIAAAAAARIQPLLPSSTVDDIEAALTEAVRKRIGRGVHVGKGTALTCRYLGDGHGPRSLIVTDEDDDGFLTIDRATRYYKPGDAGEPMNRPLRVHRDLITPPFFDGETEQHNGRSESFLTTPASVTARGGGTDLSDAAKSDMGYQRDDVTEIVADVLATDNNAVIDAVDAEADEAVRVLMKDSPANGPGPVRFIIAGVSEKPVGCKLTDIELPFATATVSSRKGVRSARINVYTRGAFRDVE